MATVNRAYRFALSPSPAQKRMLRSHAGAARFAWNWGLARCKERYAAERKWYSSAELHKLWNAAKKADPDLGWWAENSKCCYQEAFRNLDRALRDFIKSKKGLRKGKKLGFPRRKKKGRARDSFRLYGTLRCAGGTVTLPRLGTMRTHEDTGKLAAKIADGTARITSATVSRIAQRWFVSFTVEEQQDTPQRHARPGTAIGIDLGVKTMLTGIDDQGAVVTVPGPKPLRAALRRLRRASRSCSRKQPGSARRECGMAAAASLDGGLLIGADHILVVAERRALKHPGVEIQRPGRLDREVRIAGEDPHPVKPRADGVTTQRAPHRRRRDGRHHRPRNQFRPPAPCNSTVTGAPPNW